MSSADARQAHLAHTALLFVPVQKLQKQSLAHRLINLCRGLVVGAFQYPSRRSFSLQFRAKHSARMYACNALLRGNDILNRQRLGSIGLYQP
jgi:hypothetical protein